MVSYIGLQYASRTLNKVKRKFNMFEQEAAAVIFSLKNFRHYLLAGPFPVYSDHETLHAASNKAVVHGRLAWWLNYMAEYEFEI